ncbi:hypothetical protein BH18ACI5_BH18ACI5_24800 [soil metagenome]
MNMATSDHQHNSETHDKDKESREALPVTGEVGSEGGSYSDATVQVATLHGDVGRTAQASEPGEVTTGKDDVLRYPDEKADER